MNENSAAGLRSLVRRHQRKIFALALYLSGNDRDEAYEITVAAIIKAIEKVKTGEGDDTFIAYAMRAVVDTCKDMRLAPVVGTIALTDIAENELIPLQILVRALHLLAFEEKTLIILRDQQHLPYEMISAITHTPETDARVSTERAREHLRAKIEEILNAK